MIRLEYWRSQKSELSRTPKGSHGQNLRFCIGLELRISETGLAFPCCKIRITKGAIILCDLEIISKFRLSCGII